MDKTLILIHPNSISSKDKEKLTKLGNVVIETANLSDISFRVIETVNSLTFEYTNCITCGDRIYMTKERFVALKLSHELFFCPQGHSQKYIKS